MINELFPFQKLAVAQLREKIAQAQEFHRASKTPQVVSLQAPTGSGKTIMMASVIERIYTGDETHPEQPGAIFVWLSDSPELNQQSKDKIDVKADRLSPGQTEVIEDASFDREVLEDGKIYFLNTQKLSRSGNLGRHSDGRQWTIWETLENTAQEKGDHLYFIIDEAHRGMMGRDAASATSIMQRFLKGCEDPKLSPMPLVIGMSATAERFTRLVQGITSTLHQVVVTADMVRSSGLLKDRIIITYPKDGENDKIAVLMAAAKEWKDKCEHWQQYCREQHYALFNPVFVVQVLNGRNDETSDTDLAEAISKVETVVGKEFEPGEVVHAFGADGELVINGLRVPKIEASRIQDSPNVKVVLFKESLATGWDCPRAETMMSFRAAQDKTYIAQLLGRMIRTPLQCRILVDTSLNDVRLFLPEFNRDNVSEVVDELRSSECGEIPADIEGEELGSRQFATWSIHNKPRRQVDDPNQAFLDFSNPDDTECRPIAPQPAPSSEEHLVRIPAMAKEAQEKPNVEREQPEVKQQELAVEIDRAEVVRAVRKMAITTYHVRSVQINDYLESAMAIASLLTRTGVYPEAKAQWMNVAITFIRGYIQEVHTSGKYRQLEESIRKMKLASAAFDVSGGIAPTMTQTEMAFVSDDNIERRCRLADQKLGGCGFVQEYGRQFATEDNPEEYKIDCIIFAEDDEAVERLRKTAKITFQDYNDNFRRLLADRDEETKREYDQIVSNGDPVSKHNFELAENVEGFSDAEGREFRNHLYLDDTGVAKIKLGSSWEYELVEEECKASDFVCWVRNLPRRPTSLCIPYTMNGQSKPMYPDFLVIRRDYKSSTGYVVDVLEPHGSQYADNLPKAKGLAEYARTESRVGRVQLIRKVNDRLLRLDLCKGEIRDRVLSAMSDDDLCAIFDKFGYSVLA